MLSKFTKALGAVALAAGLAHAAGPASASPAPLPAKVVCPATVCGESATPTVGAGEAEASIILVARRGGMGGFRGGGARWVHRGGMGGARWGGYRGGGRWAVAGGRWGARPGWGRPGWGYRPGWGRPGWGHRPGWGRPGWGYRPGWGRPGWGWNNRWRPGWGWGVPVVAGVGYWGWNNYYNDYYGAPAYGGDLVAYCTRTFRTYNPRTGMYRARSGRWVVCRLPY